MKKARFPRTVILVAAFYLVAAISAAITQQNWEFLKVYIPFFVVIAAVVAKSSHPSHFNFPDFVH